MKLMLFLAAILLCMSGCSQIDYVGRQYPPTTTVDLYFSFDDVPKDYEVMGQIVATGSEMVSAEGMQEKMMQKAREKGADAIVILGLERHKTGESQTYKENIESTAKENAAKQTTTAVTTTSNEERKEIRATLIKYK